MDLMIKDGLAKRLVEEICKKGFVSLSNKDMYIRYGDMELEGGTLLRGLHDGNVEHMGIHFVESETRLDCYVLARSKFDISLKAAHLISFEEHVDVDEILDRVFADKPVPSVSVEMDFKLLRDMITEIFPKVAKEYVALLRETKKTDYVRYKVLELSGALCYEAEKVLETGDYVLSYFDNEIAKGRCAAEEGKELECILKHIQVRRYKTPIAVGSYTVIVWQRDGSEGLSARLLRTFGGSNPTVGNGGAVLGSYSVVPVNTFNYTFDSVASEKYYLDFGMRRVLSVEEQSDSNAFYAVNLSYDFGFWKVLTDNGHSIAEQCGFETSSFNDTMKLLDEHIVNLKGMDYYREVYIGKTSPGGLHNIVKYRQEAEARC